MSPVQQQHIRVGSDLVATPASSTSTLSQASPDAVVAVAQSTSDSHCNRDVVAIALTLSNVPTADDPLMHTLHDLVVARGAEAFVALVGAPHALSRAALHQLLVTDFGGRALAIGVKWREEDSLQITGIVTCGPASLGQHWRLSAVFSAAHKVPLTLNVMQVAARMWFATLGRQWPRSVSWRAARGSVEGRRILETLLVFHAKKPGPRRPELWASIVATGEMHDLAPVEVRIGAGPFGSDLLDDLATWGVGTARWNVEGSPAVLREAAALSPDWSGYVLHCAELPMSCRGFQHLTPADREALLGQPIAELLNSIAVTQRAAIAKLRSLEAKLPLSSTATAAASLSTSTSMDAESDAAWKSIVTTVSLSPAAKPAAPTSMQSSICDLDEDAPWRSLFSTKSTPALSPRFAQHHDVAVLRKP